MRNIILFCGNMINKIFEFTKKQWEETGLLDDVPKDKIDCLVALCNLGTLYLYNNKLYNDHYAPNIFTIIKRIYLEIDLEFNNVVEIIEEIRTAYPKIDYTKCYNNIDAEAEFGVDYSLTYINKIQKNN